MINNEKSLRHLRSANWEEVRSYTDANGIGILNEHKGLEEWMYCQVKTKRLRNMHGDFGRLEDGFVKLKKGELLNKQFLQMKSKIEAGQFPRHKKIRELWPNKPTIVVQRTLSSGELYVADGVTRTFNAFYHNEGWLDAFVITLDQEREVK